MKKRLLLLILCAVLAFNSSFTAWAAAVPSDYDPFGTAALGPDAPDISAVYKRITRLDSYKIGTEVFEMQVIVNNRIMPLYISFPSLGGFRFYSMETGGFEPQSLSEIVYGYTADGSIAMTGTDGTTVVFTPEAAAFNIKIYDAKGRHIIDFGSEHIKFGYNGSRLSSVFLQLPLRADEVIYGTGERFSGFDQNGRRTIMWNVDCGYHGDSENAELWRGYKNIPIIHSGRGYTLFYNSYYSAEVDIGYTDPSHYSFEFAGPELDFYFWTGEPLENIEKYTDLTGKSILPPKWAFRYLAGGGNAYWYGNNWGENNDPDQYIARLQSVIDNFKSIGTPDIAAIYCEGYIADNDAAYELLNSNGTKLLRWNSPDLSIESISELLPGTAEKDFPIVKQIATDYYSGTFIDFTHKNAAQLMHNSLERYTEKGMRGGILDFGELIQPNTVFSDNSTGETMHNKFSVLYAKGYKEAMDTLTVGDYLLISRAAAAGSQSYTACFSGDQAATFYGLKQQLSAGLSLSASGFSIWGGDLAGYEGTPTTEVFCRGTQLSAFYPLMRAHGTRSRMPWDYGEDGIKNHQIYYWLRENLLDTVYSSAIDSSITGLPMMRAFAIEFPQQQELAGIDDSYIFCEDFLVAPVLEAGAVSREVTFPEGRWYSLWDGGSIDGGTVCTVSAPITQIPVYIRSGAAVPLRLSENYQLAAPISEGKAIKTLLVTPAEDSHSKTFYADSETCINYTNRRIDGGYRITAESGNETTAVKAVGTNALAVVADGEKLQKLSRIPMENEKGYYVADDCTTVISLAGSDWKQIDIITGDETKYSEEWDFASASELSDFDVYLNDTRITGGYAELQPSDVCFAWKEGGYIEAEGTFYDDAGTGYYWAGMSNSSVSLSPKNKEFRNFEAEVEFKIKKGGGSTGAVMIGFRETIPGAHKPQGYDSWSFGLQDSSEKIYSALVSAIAGNKIRVHNAGNVSLDEVVTGADFLTVEGYYKIKLRVVENSGKVTVYSPEGKELYSSAFEVYENLAESGAVSFYANGPCAINSVRLINLDENGRPQPFEGYEEYIREKSDFSVSEWKKPSGFDIYEQDGEYVYRYDANAYDSFALSAVNTGDSPLVIGVGGSGAAMPSIETGGIVCRISDNELTVKKYEDLHEKTDIYQISQESKHSVSLSLEDGKLTLSLNGTVYILDTKCGAAYPFIKSKAGAAKGINFQFENTFDVEFGYSANIAIPADIRETGNEYWNISAEGTFTRRSVAGIEENSGDEWYGSENNTSDMAFIYFPEQEPSDLLLTFKIKAGINRSGRIYAGIGGSAGKTWRDSGGGAVFFITENGNLQVSGFIESKDAWTEGKTLGTIAGYDPDRTYSVSLRRTGGNITVFIDGVQTAELPDREWLCGSVYFASNSFEASVSDIKISRTVPFGDVNYDFIIGQDDFESICSALLNGATADIIDIDRNGKTDICDAVVAYNKANGFSGSSFSDETALSLTADSGFETVRLTLSSNTCLGGILAEIVADTELLLFDASKAILTANAEEAFISEQGTPARICLVDVQTGELAELPFKVNTRDYVVTEVVIVPLSAAGSDGKYVTCGEVSCTVEINRQYLGDVNDDMQVDIRDLICLKKYLIGEETNINETKADCDFNDRIDAPDMVLIKRLLIEDIDKI